MLTDTRIIMRTERYAVQAQRQEVLLRDGSLLDLRPVIDEQAVDRGRFLRALLMPSVACFIFDVRDMAPELNEELRTCADRDVPGTVFIALRTRYPRGLDFHRAVGQHLKATIAMTEQTTTRFAACSGVPNPVTADGERRFWPVRVGVDMAEGPAVGVEAAWVDGRLAGLRETKAAA